MQYKWSKFQADLALKGTTLNIQLFHQAQVPEENDQKYSQQSWRTLLIDKERGGIEQREITAQCSSNGSATHDCLLTIELKTNSWKLYAKSRLRTTISGGWCEGQQWTVNYGSLQSAKITVNCCHLQRFNLVYIFLLSCKGYFTQFCINEIVMAVSC